MKRYLKSYAARIAEQFALLGRYETEFEKTRLWIVSQPNPQGQDFIPDAEARKSILNAAQILSEVASDCDLKVSPSKLDSLTGAVEATSSPSIELRHRIRDARETMIQELDLVMFLPASTEMSRYLDKSMPFGEEVSSAFPSCTEDISECHQCFALERYTAAMFHLGRAMELVVTRLAKKMSIKIQRDDWQSYLNAMNEKIAQMPFRTPQDKKKRTPYTEAAAYLLHFKEAWRNNTMHPKKTYTRQESLDVINCASAFLRAVSQAIFKKRKKA